jgi:uncharacterized protein YqgC (DUF456 family)
LVIPLFVIDSTFDIRHSSLARVTCNQENRMHILIATLLAIVNLVFLVSVIFGLPGTWLMVLATALVAWWQRDLTISPWTLLAMGLIALAAEVVELLAGLLGASRAGGGWRASLAATVGGLVGAVAGTLLIPVPILGTLVGACAGAGLAATAVHRSPSQSPQLALRVGLSAGIGRLVGTLVKLALALLIWIIATIASFWP